MATATPTQSFVPIKEVRDGIVTLNDNSLRVILLASSINFALKSEDTQQAILSQFQNFLNTVDFSVQIVASSRRLDIKPYLALLEERYRMEKNDLMKIQTREYIEFIRNFTDNSNIMAKTFFVIVPYSPAIISVGKTSRFGKFFGAMGNKLPAATKGEELNDNFEESRSQLEQRVAIVEQGLIRSGIRTVQLGTEEVVELFYKLFNPGDTEKPIQIN